MFRREEQELHSCTLTFPSLAKDGLEIGLLVLPHPGHEPETGIHPWLLPRRRRNGDPATGQQILLLVRHCVHLVGITTVESVRKQLILLKFVYSPKALTRLITMFRGFTFRTSIRGFPPGHI